MTEHLPSYRHDLEDTYREPDPDGRLAIALMFVVVVLLLWLVYAILHAS